MNGSRNYFRNVVIVFTYVALWHDFSFNLLSWAYILIIGISVEHSIQYHFKRTKLYHDIKHKFYYKYIVCLSLYFSVFFLISSNHFGFGIGFSLSINGVNRWIQSDNKYTELIHFLIWTLV